MSLHDTVRGWADELRDKMGVPIDENGNKRIETMDELSAVLKKARSEEFGIPLSTIAVVLAEALGDTHDVRSVIKSLEQYIS